MSEEVDKNKNLFSQTFPENGDNRDVIEDTLECLLGRLSLLDSVVDQRCHQMKERLQQILSFQVNKTISKDFWPCWGKVHHNQKGNFLRYVINLVHPKCTMKGRALQEMRQLGLKVSWKFCDSRNGKVEKATQIKDWIKPYIQPMKVKLIFYYKYNF